MHNVGQERLDTLQGKQSTTKPPEVGFKPTPRSTRTPNQHTEGIAFYSIV